MGRDVPNHRLECGVHLVTMCLDAGIDPHRARIVTHGHFEPLRFASGGMVWMDDPGEKPLQNLVNDFCSAIERGEPNNIGLVTGAKAVEFLCR